MRLIDNARQAWRFFSVQAMTLALAVQGAWVALPRDMVATIPEPVVTVVTMVLLALGVFGRLIKQDLPQK